MSIKKRDIGIVEKRAWIGTLNWDPTGFFTTTGVQKNLTARSEHVATCLRPDNSVEYAV
jgi:hypothetical protein